MECENCEMEEKNLELSDFRVFVDRLCQIHPECKNYYEEKVATCNEFLDVVNKMQGTDLEPYLAETKCVSYEGCFSITFKIPLVPYSELICQQLEIRNARRNR